MYAKVKIGDEYFIALADYFSKKSSGPDDVSECTTVPFAQEPAATLAIVSEFLGKTLVGKKYEPPFDYFKGELHKHKTHAWKVYAGDFVTLESGTGIVHIAPAFGADDLALAQKEKIPLIHHVTDEGKFIATVTDFAHLPVKPKGNPKETDGKIVKSLDEKGLLYSQEN